LESIHSLQLGETYKQAPEGDDDRRKSSKLSRRWPRATLADGLLARLSHGGVLELRIRHRRYGHGGDDVMHTFM
jgi:hypothetical protein